MATFQKTYWASNGRFQAMAEHLAAALPQYGAVKELPNLEKFRQLQNMYYDAHNNLGLNYPYELCMLAKVPVVAESPVRCTHIAKENMGKVYKKLEKEMDKIIPVAFVELFERPNADDEKKIDRLEKQNAKLQKQVDAMRVELNGRYQQIEKLQNETDTLAKFSSKGGKVSKRKITPEQQAKMQAARKKGKAK